MAAAADRQGSGDGAGEGGGHGGPGRAERLRATPMLVTLAALQLAAVAVFLLNVAGQRTPVALGWLPVIGSGVLAGLSCRQAAAAAGLNPVGRRVWRQLAGVCALVTLATVGDARLAVTHSGSVDQKQHDTVTSVLYGLSLVLLLWALLRLPVGARNQRDRMVRFVLDAATVSVTVSVFAWYVAVHTADPTDGSRSAIVPMIMLASVGLIGSLAFVKVAISGLGGLDRVTIRLLAAAAAAGAGGGLLPLLVSLHPGLSGTQISVPGTMLFVAFAADRQRRAAAAPPVEHRRRTFSLCRTSRSPPLTRCCWSWPTTAAPMSAPSPRRPSA